MFAYHAANLSLGASYTPTSPPPPSSGPEAASSSVSLFSDPHGPYPSPPPPRPVDLKGNDSEDEMTLTDEKIVSEEDYFADDEGEVQDEELKEDAKKENEERKEHKNRYSSFFREGGKIIVRGPNSMKPRYPGI
ncbi:MAG: hypothetical protein Q9191_004970, partial [Dirinaria sp. TL-2023a]